MSLIRFYFLFLLLIPLETVPTFSIMLDPAGDAKYPGHQIGDSLERGISLHYAKALKKKLEESYCDIRVILTRVPGETIYPLQNANFANKLSVDFYVSLHFYAEEKTKPSMFLYYFSRADEFVTKIPNLFFCPYDQAHRINGATTRRYAQNIARDLSSDTHRNLFNFSGPKGIPFKPLVGVHSPAIALEIGLKKKDDWKNYVDCVAQSLGTILKNL